MANVSRAAFNSSHVYDPVNQLQTVSGSQQQSPGVNAPAHLDETLRVDDPHARASFHKPSWSLADMARQIDRRGRRLEDHNGDHKVRLSYTFNEIARNESKFNETQKDQARRSMQAWADVARVTFEEEAVESEGRLRFVNDKTPAVADGLFSHRQGRVRVNPSYADNRVPTVNGFGRHTLTHEIGHTLGAAHTGDYDTTRGPVTYPEHATYAQDSRAYSVMSYFDESHTHQDFKGQYASSPLMADIAWSQRVYGANHQTRNTDTTYGFNSNTQRDDLSLNSSRDGAVFCVWDGGGNDTLDFSGYHQNQVINLRAGSFSDVGGLKGNVSIANGVTLENAIGGSGHDVLIGNDADNRLKGGAGADHMRGGAGSDTFVYDDAADATLYAPDQLMDFVSGQDKIDISPLLRKHDIRSLIFINQFTGRAGEVGVGYDPQKDESWVVLDLTGNGEIDFFLESRGPIGFGDIIGDVPVSYHFT
ncbi:M10 family metallopeptidase C-terminal domain-containing protein [Pseudomonas sp. R5-89-07]|uniref:M10 family metallopeptidase C-terminal domain-containing protein n=1 Tax=Pseudomonas sp. R5-89-07 TaxID=658644 RepID=UPI000F6BFCCF|nr:M10 family metallopeptidase C-terminal domain-containing protein [Pseudomonas sp. R5-89-07]AZF05256.1 Secreted alkaline metalloproteinase [Pseudomonas sp. R5-89-07]